MISPTVGQARNALYAGTAAFALMMPGVAFAQEELAQPADASTAVEEEGDGNAIIVTATKREQTLQEIPVAVSVTTAETVERAQIRDLKDLTSVVPSLRVNQLQSSANTNFIIRGFGNGANNAGIEPSVGVFIDGVYRSRSAAQIGDFPDIQRIEVLRGPQSTLFGKNASAGVISIITREPQFTFGGNVEASYGNWDAIVVKGVVTGPVTDTLALSVAGGINKRDGYVEELGPRGGQVNERDRWFVKGQALFEPTDALKIRVIGDYSKIDEVCCSVVNLRRGAVTGAIEALGGRVSDFRRPFDDVSTTNFPSTNDIENYGVSGQVDYSFGPLTLTSITAYRRVDAVTDQDSDFTTADLIGRNFADTGIKTFTQELRLASDLDGPLNFLLGGFYFDEKIEQRNEIFFGTQFRPYANALIGGSPLSTANVAALESQFGALMGNPALFTGRFFRAGDGLNEQYGLKNEAYSLFGQIDFEITDGLTLTAGANYTKDKKRVSTNIVSTDTFSGLNLPAIRTAAVNAGIAQQVGGILGVPGGFANAAQIAAFAQAQPAIFGQIQTGVNTATAPILALAPLQFLPPFQNIPNAVESGRTRDSDWSYTARLAYDVTDQINVYASYTTGFKASSINLSRDSRPTQADLVALRNQGLAVVNLRAGTRFAAPEETTVYEIGLKADWGLVSVNFAAFDQSIKGFQSNVFTGTGFGLANAGEQSVQGFEFEGMVKPVDPLTLTVALTYLDAKYDDFATSSIGDITGTTPAGIAPISVTFGAQYDHEIGNGDHIILRGDFHYESDVQINEGSPAVFGATGSTAAAVAAYREFRRDVNDLNASLTYAMENGLELSVWGRNLLDDRYITTVFDSVAQSGSISGYTNQPRTYGVSARFRF